MIHAKNISNKYFSSDIPDFIYSTDSNSDAVFQILDEQDNTVHIAILSPYQGYITLYELSELFTDYMRKYNKTILSFHIDVVQGISSIRNTITVIYCTDIPAQSPEEFLANHFLTLTDVKETQPDTTEYFHFIGYDTPKISILTENEPPVYTLLPDTHLINGVTSFSFSLNDLALQANLSINEIKGCKVSAGDRIFHLFKGNAHNTMNWRFCNAFNVMETFAVPGALSIITKDAHNTAKVSRKLVAYDFNKSQQYEYESTPLNRQEFLWASQLLASNCIIDQNNRQIIITDAESEIKVLPGEENKIKFSWQYEHGKGLIGDDSTQAQQYSRIHTEEYDKQYN